MNSILGIDYQPFDGRLYLRMLCEMHLLLQDIRNHSANCGHRHDAWQRPRQNIAGTACLRSRSYIAPYI